MIRIHLLGALEMTEPDGTSVLSVLSQPKRMGLLAFLLTARPRGFHSRDKLLALFWPETDEEHARNSLRQALYFLRRSLGEEGVISRGEDIGVDPSLFSCDVLSFDEAMDAGEWGPALDLYRGPFLEGFHVSGAPEFDRWLEGERERLRVAAARALEALVGEREDAGDLAGATEAARRWVQFSPASGPAAQRLIRLLAEKGDRTGALTAFERFRQRLWEDFGLEPTEELERLVQRIRQGSGPATAGVTREGEGPSLASTSGEGSSPDPDSPRNAAPFQNAPPETTSATPDTPSGTLRHRRPLPRRSSRPKASWTMFAFVATIACGYVLFFLARPDRRTPVRLTGFQDLNGTIEQAGFSPQLLEKILEVMESSKVVRPVRDDSDFLFLQSGSVANDSVRLVVDDLDPETGPALVSAHPFNAPLSETELEGLATLLAQEIETAATGPSHVSVPTRGTSNPVAFQAYLEGRALWALRNPGQFGAAKRAFEEAVRVDPSYALAYAALADVINLLGAYDYGLLHPDSAYRLAKRNAERAYSLDPDLAEAQAALATTQFFYEWNFAGAEALYRSALRLDPTYETGHQWLSLLLAVQKRFDPALAQIREAMRDDSSEVILAARARVHYFARDFRQALSWYDRTLEVGDHFIPAHLGRGLTALMAGEVETALEAYDNAERYLGGPVPVTLAVKGHLLGRIGDTVGAKEVLGYLEQARTDYEFVPPEYLAMVHLGLGEHERAMDYLEEAYRNGSNVMNILEVEPLLDPLQTNERFLRLKTQVREGRIR